VPLYRPEPGKIVGRTEFPDPKLATFVQPEGREWRTFRVVALRIVAAVLILGVLAALAAFYAWRGTIRIRHGRAGTTLPRFNGFERGVHWMTAASFILMALTGLVVTFGRPLLIPLLGHDAFTRLAEASKYGHNFFSVPFTLGVIVILLMWIRDNIPERADITWIRQGGGILGGDEHPEAGRFNAGQKMIFWSVVIFGLGLAVTGFLLMTPFYATNVNGMQLVHVFHGLLAAVLIMIIIGHIYIGTLGMEGAFDAMGSGQVDENWAREHHSGWYAQVRRTGDPRGTPAE
jgi:formate dehydrogenase subunit gamma